MFSKDIKKIVVKVGSSTLTHENGKLNLKRIDELVRVLSDLKNMGYQPILVTSGAQAAGVARLKMPEKPKQLPLKQAVAAVGQSILMHIYDKFFGEYGHTVAQILLTKDAVFVPERYENAHNTMCALLELGAIPIVNENDSMSTEQIEFGDNDTLSAYVAKLCMADLLIVLTDIDGLYDKNPKENSDASLISVVEQITDEIRKNAGGAGTKRGTGGMHTKLNAAEIAMADGIDMIIANGENPQIIYELLKGNIKGTLFKAKQKK